jgi:hypothetical protein
MIKSIIFSSILHILIALIVIFNIGNSEPKKPKQTKEIKVNIIEERIKKTQPKKKVKSENKIQKKKKRKIKKKPKLKPKKTEIKNEIPKKTIMNKKPPKKQEKKKIKQPKVKKIEKKPEKSQIYDIKEYNQINEIGISDREKSNLKFQIIRCYQESKKGFKKFNIDVNVNVQVKENGVIDYNNMVFTNQIALSKIDPKILSKITKSIAKTLKDCSPIRNLPEEKYDIWRKMNIKFKY